MTEGAKISFMSIRWLTAFLDTQRAVDSDALVFWEQITSATPSEWRGSACEFATLLPGNGYPRLRVQAVDGNRAECYPKVETVIETLRESAR